MKIDVFSSASLPQMHFISTAPDGAGLTTAQRAAEHTLGNLLSTDFVNDVADLFKPADTFAITAGLTALKAELLAGISIDNLFGVLVGSIGELQTLQPKSDYDRAAGKAIAASITQADTNAVYALLPAGTISHGDLDAAVSALKSALRSGQGFI